MRLRSAGWASVGDTPTDRPGLFAQVVVRMFFDLPVSLFGLNGPSGWLCQAEAHRSNDRWGGAGSDLALLAESLHGRLYALPGDNVRFSKQTSRRPLVPKNVFFFRIFLITPSPIPIINYLSTKSSSLPNRDKSVKYPFHSLSILTKFLSDEYISDARVMLESSLGGRIVQSKGERVKVQLVWVQIVSNDVVSRC
jgi:hypothetical protein